jgi:hypothetical protein
MLLQDDSGSVLDFSPLANAHRLPFDPSPKEDYKGEGGISSIMNSTLVTYTLQQLQLSHKPQPDDHAEFGEEEEDTCYRGDTIIVPLKLSPTKKGKKKRAVIRRRVSAPPVSAPPEKPKRRSSNDSAMMEESKRKILASNVKAAEAIPDAVESQHPPKNERMHVARKRLPTTLSLKTSSIDFPDFLRELPYDTDSSRDASPICLDRFRGDGKCV